MTRKALKIVIALLVLLLIGGCVIGSVLGVYAYNQFAAIQPVACEPVACEPVACEPVAPEPMCNPYLVYFEDMGELNPAVSTKIDGPAIYEWWTGGTNEGVQRVDAGHSITIRGAKGHYWALPSQQDLDCAWALHVHNYADKPQHADRTYDQLVIPPPASLLK